MCVKQLCDIAKKKKIFVIFNFIVFMSQYTWLQKLKI